MENYNPNWTPPDWWTGFLHKFGPHSNPYAALSGPKPPINYDGAFGSGQAPADVTGSTPPSPGGSPTGSLFDAPLPTPRPSAAALSAYNSPPVRQPVQMPVPLPPVRPYDLGGTAPEPAESAPATLPGDASNNDYWSNERSRDMIGPGHWLDPTKLGGIARPGSLVGKLMAMRNPKPGPGVVTPQQPQGLLPQLYHGLFDNGGIFGSN